MKYQLPFEPKPLPERTVREPELGGLNKIGEPELKLWHCERCGGQFETTDADPCCMFCDYGDCKPGPSQKTLSENVRINAQEDYNEDIRMGF